MSKISKLSSQEITDLLVQDFHDEVTEFLPGHYKWSDDTGREYIDGEYVNEVKGWVDDVLIDIEDVLAYVEDGVFETEIEAIAHVVNGKMMETYYTNKALAGNYDRDLLLF